MIADGKRYKGLQVYKEKKIDCYYLIDHTVSFVQKEAVYFSAVVPGFCSDPQSVVTGQVSTRFLTENCYPVSWRKLPEIWQKAFQPYIGE